MESAAGSPDVTRIKRAYDVLGLPPESSALQIKREYRRLAKRWHPDRWPRGGLQEQQAGERMRQINDAYALVRHGPLRYHADTRPGRVDSPRRVPVARAREPFTDQVEYLVRFVVGAAFGALVGFQLVVAEVPLGIAVLAPLVTGLASARFGDRFWRFILRFWWMWS